MAPATAVERPVPLSARVAARLQANGFRADDLRLSEHLAALAATRHRSARVGPRVVFDLVNVHFTQRTVFHFVPLAAGSTFNSAPSVVFKGIVSKPVVTGIEYLGGQTISITGLHLTDGSSFSGTVVKASLGSCGSNILTTLITDGQSTTGNASDLSAKNPTKLAVVLPAVAKDTSSSLIVTVGGVSSDPVSFIEPAASAAGITFLLATLAAPVGDSTPFFAGADLGVGPMSFASASTATRISTDVLGPAGSGTDVLGNGINLVNGWSAQAAISNVHSYRDTSGNDGSNDDFRSASIVQAPQSHRLQTKVAWKYAPGESVSYDVVWSFRGGIIGTRMLDSQPKQTACSDEE